MMSTLISRKARCVALSSINVDIALGTSVDSLTQNLLCKSVARGGSKEKKQKKNRGGKGWKRKEKTFTLH